MNRAPRPARPSMSIYKKIFLIAFIFILFGLTLSTLLNIQTTRSILNENAARQATTLLRSLQEKCKYAITIFDSETMEAYVDRASLDGFVRGIEGHEPAVTEVLLVDRSGMVLSAMDHVTDQQVAPRYAALLQDLDTGRILIRPETSALLLAGEIRVNESIWGTVVLEFSLLPIQAEVRRLTIQALLMSGLFLVLGAALSLPLVGTIVRPVRQLAEYAREVGEGNLEQTLSIRSRDEIGQLGEAFATMVGKLKQTMGALEQGMTELHQSEELLRRSERSYRELFENAVVGVFQCTMDGAFLRVNQAMATTLGYDTPEELIGEKSGFVRRLFVHARDRITFTDTLRRVGRVADFPAEVRTRDGRVIAATLSARTVTSGPDAQTQVEGTLMDVTARKERDKAELEREAAKAASETKSAFLANMSHEIRTPMNAILGFSHLALNLKCPGQCHDYLQKINNAANSLLGIINDILDFSRIEAGKLRIEQTIFNLDKVLSSTLENVDLKASEKGLELVLDVSPDVPRDLIGDPTRLGQVLLNLVGNAVKFTSQGRVSLSVSLEDRTSESARLRFCITDTGIGLNQTQLAALFTPFTQADHSTTRKYGGSGLGLAICKSLVEQMQGRIGVTSVPDQGSQFHFTLPFCLSSVPAIESDPVCSPVRPDFQGARVLVVEDNEMNQQVARDFLEAEGIMVTVVENGLKALELLKLQSFDLIFMDVQMPVMDGLTATRIIRKAESAGLGETDGIGLDDVNGESEIAEPSIGTQQTVNSPTSFSLHSPRRTPIIAMSAHAMLQDQEVCLETGMDACLTKPVQQAALEAILQNWLPAQALPRKPAPGDEPPGKSIPSAAHGSAELAALQTGLPGIDVQSGLTFANQNLRLYRELLTQFPPKSRELLRCMDQAVIQGDEAETGRAAHTLKSISRLLGAEDLARIAEEVEHQARSSQVHPETHARLRTGLEQVLTVLQAHAAAEAEPDPRSGPAEPDRKLNIPAAMQLVDDLRYSLQSDMKHALRQAMALEAMLAETGIGVAVSSLKNDIYEFETTTALERLEEIEVRIKKLRDP